MKRVQRGLEPIQLATYRATNRTATWEQMRANAQGRTAYEVTRAQLIDEQGGLCAFCEIDIRDNDSLKCRIEHFHPKSDTSTMHNWALDWHNMLGVCMGGSQRHQQPPHALEPLQENLSCDAHKDRMIQLGRLNEHCEGWIINPMVMPWFSCLFVLEKSTGRLLPAENQCAEVSVPGNQHVNTSTLVQHTIDMLNLNCDRLCTARQLVLWDIERNKRSYRQQGIQPQNALRDLAERYFRRRWPGFFTTIRLCLGAAAEQYLIDTGFQG